jgi:hypothetical protein
MRKCWGPKGVSLARLQRSLGIGLVLGGLIGSGCAVPPASPSQPGTLMKTSCPSSIGLPTVEECVDATSEITSELLSSCMRQQCRNLTITCGEWSRSICRAENQSHAGSALIAFTVVTYYGTLHSFFPVQETYWCEEPAAHSCVVKAVIHEIAHSCGWDHKQGHNVPGNDAPELPIPECACVDEKGARTSCR